MLTTSLGVGLIVPLLPVYAQTMGASGFWIGLIFGANPLMRGLFTLVMGSLADRSDKKNLMLAGLLGYAATAMAFMFSATPWQLFLARLAQGAFSAMIMPVARAYAGELAPKGQEGTIMGQFALAFTMGFALGPLMGGTLNDVLGLRAPFFGMAVLSLLAWALVWRAVPRRPVTVRYQQRGLDFRPLQDRQVLGLVAGRTFVEIGRGLFSALMPLIGASTLGLTSAQTGFVVTLRSSTESVLQPVSGKVADRYNRRTVCLVGFMLMPVALLLTPLARTYAALGVAAMLLGSAAGVAVPAAAAIAVDKGRKFGMGSMMGIDSTAQALGMAAGATLGGSLMEAFSTAVAFRTAAVLALLGSAVFAALTKGYVNNEAGRAADEVLVAGAARLDQAVVGAPVAPPATPVARVAAADGARNGGGGRRGNGSTVGYGAGPCR